MPTLVATICEKKGGIIAFYVCEYDYSKDEEQRTYYCPRCDKQHLLKLERRRIDEDTHIELFQKLLEEFKDGVKPSDC